MESILHALFSIDAAWLFVCFLFDLFFLVLMKAAVWIKSSALKHVYENQIEKTQTAKKNWNGKRILMNLA